MRHPRSRQAGIGLLEPLIAIAILSFGILGLARFQLNMLGQASDTRARLAATAMAETLLAQVRVDLTNAHCYVDTPVGCPAAVKANIQAGYETWVANAKAALPGTPATPSTAIAEFGVPEANQLRVRMSWTSKGSADTHTYEAITDVRP